MSLTSIVFVLFAIAEKKKIAVVVEGTFCGASVVCGRDYSNVAHNNVTMFRFASCRLRGRRRVGDKAVVDVVRCAVRCGSIPIS